MSPRPGDDPAGASDDERFAELVERLRREPWPEPEVDDAPRPADVAPPASDAAAGLPAQWRSPTGLGEPVGDEGTFEPPQPAPLPAGDLSFWGAVAGLVGGPAWLLYLALAAPYTRALWWVLACALTAAGFALLVARQPGRRDDDWDDDVDGARL